MKNIRPAIIKNMINISGVSIMIANAAFDILPVFDVDVDVDDDNDNNFDLNDCLQ